MTQFRYQGRDGNGAAQRGVLEAADSGAAASALLQLGLTPVHIAAVTANRAASVSASPADWLSALQQGVPHEELIGFCRQMHTLLRAGVPITRALAALYESSTHRGFGAVLMDLRQKLESGRELSNAMSSHGAHFDSFFRSMVRIGETTGRLDEIFLRLFSHLEFEKDMRQRVTAALRYPMFVVLALIGAMLVINIFVIPAFAGVYKSFHATLPWMTRLLIATSDFTVNEWPYLLMGMAAAALAFRSWIRTLAGRLAWDRWTLAMPIFGSLLRKAVLARFSRSLALALRSGLPVTEALDAATGTTENRYVQRRLGEMRTAIDRGESLVGAARRTKVFTPVVLQMIAIGEESGNVDDLLQEVAQSYEGDVAYELKGLADAIEPILIVALAGMVLILALGVFLPMWDLSRAALGNGRS